MESSVLPGRTPVGQPDCGGILRATVTSPSQVPRQYPPLAHALASHVPDVRAEGPAPAPAPQSDSDDGCPGQIPPHGAAVRPCTVYTGRGPPGPSAARALQASLRTSSCTSLWVAALMRIAPGGARRCSWLA